MNTFKKILAGILIGCFSAALALGLLHFDKLHALEGISFDLRARALARPGPATDDIRIILLDQKSLDWAQQAFGLEWPWPRQTFVPMVEFCRQAGAASLTFDTVFAGPSKLGPSDDQELVNGLKKMGNTVLAADFTKTGGTETVWPEPIAKPGLGTVGKPLAMSLPMGTFPAQRLASGAESVGSSAMVPDPDNVLRRIPMVISFDSTLVPSLPLAARHAAKPEPIAFASGTLTIGPLTVPVSEDGQAILNFRTKNAYKVYSAAAILESGLRLEDGKTSHIPLSEFRGKHVFFGLYDLRTSPLGSGTPGVVINATALDNLLSGDFLRPMGFEYDVAATILFAVLAGLGVAAFRTGWATVTLAGVSLLGPLAVAMATYRMNIWAGMAPQYVGVVTALLLGLVYKYATEGRQEQLITTAFSHYLSPTVINQLLNDPDTITLSGEKRELTILRAGIEGFSALSEQLTPKQLVSALSDYQTAMTEIIRETGGTVDQSSGTTITAFWNAPANQPDHALSGVKTALRCQEKLAVISQNLLRRTGCELRMRIGVHTDQAIVGDLGPHDFFNYSILGTAVDLAARIETVNKLFGTHVLISRATASRLDGKVLTREISCLKIEGSDEAVTVFEPIAEADREAMQEDAQHFSTGLGLFYEGDFAKAIAYFGVIADRDPAAARYLDKCKRLHIKKPASWDGTWPISSN